jgi:hypothetical protein
VLSKLHHQSWDALVEIVVRKRGRVRDYAPGISKRGLVVRKAA